MKSSSHALVSIRKAKYLGGHPEHRGQVDSVDVEFLEQGVLIKTRKTSLAELDWADVTAVEADDEEGVQTRITGTRVALLGPLALMAKKKRVTAYLSVTDLAGDWLFEVPMSAADLQETLLPAQALVVTPAGAATPPPRPPAPAAPAATADPPPAPAAPAATADPPPAPAAPAATADPPPAPAAPTEVESVATVDVPEAESVAAPDVAVDVPEVVDDDRDDPEPDDPAGRNWAARLRKVEDATDGYDADFEGSEQLKEDSAKWLSLAKAGGQLALATGKGPGALKKPTVKLVRALLEVEEAQARLLQSIDENVKLLRDGPFKTGRLYLTEANRLVESPEKSQKFVERAQEQFYQAHALTSDPMDRAAVEMHIGLTAVLMGEPDDARHWLEQAYEKTAVKARELAVHTGNTKVGSGKSKAALLAATAGYGVVVLAAKKYTKSRESKRSQEALRELLPLVGCISSLAQASGSDPDELPMLELRKIKRSQYELVELTD